MIESENATNVYSVRIAAPDNLDYYSPEYPREMQKRCFTLVNKIREMEVIIEPNNFKNLTGGSYVVYLLVRATPEALAKIRLFPEVSHIQPIYYNID